MLIPLSFSPHDTDMIHTITRFFGAFKKAASKLETYYTELPAQTSTVFATKEAGFPYPTTFTHLRTRVKTSFKLEFQPMPGRLMYLGQMEAGPPVLVKFVRSYSKDLHEHCAFKGLAPPLFGLEKLAGDWFMVVMEYMKDYEALSELKDVASISRQLRPMVKDLVTSFHDLNFVHGDIRDSNLLIRTEDGKLEMKLIDFDWGGKEGEVWYPVLINNRTVYRPLAVAGGQLIKREHDLHMVEYVFLGLP
jgi:serine/threonine protein kinase